MKTLFTKSVEGRQGIIASECPDLSQFLPTNLTRNKTAKLPELSELDVVRHFTELSRKNYSVDGNFYPLGSCTMKYNPKITEKLSSLSSFLDIHPILAQLPGGTSLCQASLKVLYETEKLLCEITGMEAFTFQPMAGAQGELTGVLIIAAYHKQKGNAHKKKIIVPDSSHGTNPASAAVAGFDVISIESKNGIVDPKELLKVMSDDVAGIMMTCPNTLGLFEENLPEIVEIIHSYDALLYYDGANLNAVMGKMRMGDAGFDVVHLNLHKTFATPHGGGGPGSGPVGVCNKLLPFLPKPKIVKLEQGFDIDNELPDSIGQVAPFYGSFGIILRAYIYILRLGQEGIIRATENAVLSANYMLKKLQHKFEIPYNRTCMHEFVLSAETQAKKGAKALDIAKALLDKGHYAPTIYFPLIVKECMMIEPTETESKETIDQFIADMLAIADQIDEDPTPILAAPITTPVHRIDDVKAARDMILVETDDL